MKETGVISMVFDIILVAILAIAMVKGMRSGFVYTFIHTVGWLLAALMGFVWSPKLQDYILANTEFRDKLYAKFLDKFSQSLSFRDETIENMPDILRKVFEEATSGMTASLAETVTDVVFVTLCFVAVVFAVKILLYLIAALFSKKNQDGVAGFTDGLLGLAAGFVHGLLIVFFLFAFLTVFNSFLPETMSLKIADSLSESAFAKDFYDNNLLLLVVRSFLT